MDLLVNREDILKKNLEKSLTTTSGAALKREDLEGAPKLCKGGDEDDTDKSVVCVIFKGNEVLVGKSLHEDDRKGLWVFVGGSVKEEETLTDAFNRELLEEAGIQATPTGRVISNEDMPNLFFIEGDLKGTDSEMKPNPEFEELQWMEPYDLFGKTLKSNEKILTRLSRTRRNLNKK